MKVKRGEAAAEEKSEAGRVWVMTFRERNHLPNKQKCKGKQLVLT